MSVPRTQAATAWHGPASVVGVVLGLLVEAVPLMAGAGGTSWLLFLLPAVVGAGLLAAGSTARQLGVGLLASCAAYPIALATFVVVALAG